MDWTGIATETVAVVLAAGILAAVGWIARSIRDLRDGIAAFQAASDKRLGAVEKQLERVGDLERHNVIGRVGDLERSVTALQARCLKNEDLGRVHERVDGLAKEVHSMAGKLGSVDESLGRIHEFLLNQGGS